MKTESVAFRKLSKLESGTLRMLLMLSVASSKGCIGTLSKLNLRVQANISMPKIVKVKINSARMTEKELILTIVLLMVVRK